jgi:signal transduction histidine kinase
MFGLPPDADVPYERFLALVHSADRSRVIAAIERSTDPSGDGSYDVEYRIVRPDRREVWVRGIGRVFFEERDGKRQAVRFIGTALDIHGSKQTQEHLQRWGSELQQAVNLKTIELVQSQERLRALTNELNLTEQRERKRLAGDLHDYLAQLLVVIRMKLRQAVPLVPAEKAAALLKDADQALTQALDYTRSLVTELAPPSLNEFGLLQSVEWLASQMRQHGLRVEVQPGAETLYLPEDQAILLFQSVRELLYNVLKHAHTDEATVSLSITPNSELHITVEDKGAGFDAAALELQGDATRFGLFSLKERMATMGGRVSIDSAVGRGTKIALLIPYWPVRPAPSLRLTLTASNRYHRRLTQTTMLRKLRSRTNLEFGYCWSMITRWCDKDCAASWKAIPISKSSERPVMEKPHLSLSSGCVPRSSSWI